MTSIPPEAGPRFDWAGFVETADRHKILDLAYRAFSSGRVLPRSGSVPRSYTELANALTAITGGRCPCLGGS